MVFMPLEMLVTQWQQARADDAAAGQGALNGPGQQQWWWWDGMFTPDR